MNKRIDCHLHMLGDGSSGSGCTLNMSSLVKKIKGHGLLHLMGLPRDCIGKSLDIEYKHFVLKTVRESSLDCAVILAQDKVYHDDGTADDSLTLFFTPDEYVISLAKEYPEFIPAASIHPYRTDAIEALNRASEAGVRILKYLPAVLNIDFERAKIRPFIQKAADLGFIFLVHTGGELSLPVIRPEFHNPKYLSPILEAGATVIAAHGGTSSHYFDPDYKGEVLSMLKRFKNLYIDNSGCNTPFRSRHLPALTMDEFSSRVLYGSDLPIPVSPFWLYFRRELKSEQYRECLSENNVLNRDILIKKHLGFNEGSQTLLSKLLSL